MPKADTTPKALRPFVSNGVFFTRYEADEAFAVCPFCGAEDGKFSVNVETGKFGCYHKNSCGVEGNATMFLRKLYERCPPDGLEELREKRHLLTAETLEAWGVRRHLLLGDPVLPGYAITGRLDQLHRYALGGKGGRSPILATAGMETTLFGTSPDLYHPARKTLYVCEGPWDAMALWEVLRRTKSTDAGLKPTGNPAASLAVDANVIAVPGAGVCKDAWLKLFEGKEVVLCYDNDKAGTDGMRRVCQLLASHPHPPESVRCIDWREMGGVPDGYDVRDCLASSGTLERRILALSALLNKAVKPVPDDWVTGRGANSARGSLHLEPLKCTSYRQLVNEWRKAMDWTDDLDHLLSVCLAGVLSTETVGQQLWVLVMAPPSSGKTTVCEALAVARDYVHCKSVLGRVYSGYKIDKEGSEDFGDVPLIKGKTLVVKDGDTLLKDPNRGVILAQYRDLYDGAGRMKYNNGLAFAHEGLRFTFILCGTAAMREMDASEVGARFVNCSFGEHTDPERERRINRRVVNRAFRDVRMIANGKPESHADADMTRAKQLTGGYVNHLRENTSELLASVGVSDEAGERVIDMGELVAMLRARPPKKQDEVVEREMSHRLVEQFARLAICLAAVLGRKELDEDVIRRVRRCALDTARGRMLDVARLMASHDGSGWGTAGLSVALGEDEDKTRSLLRFMVRIGAAEHERGPMPKWRLTPNLHKLLREVCNAEG